MSAPAAGGGNLYLHPVLDLAPRPVGPGLTPLGEAGSRPTLPPPLAASVVTTPVVEQAKGVLALRYAVSSYEALGILARWARSADVELVDVARTLVEGVCQGRRRTLEEQRGLVRWLEHALREEHHPDVTVPVQRVAPD